MLRFLVVFAFACYARLVVHANADDLFATWFVDQHKESGDFATPLVVDGTIPEYIQGNLIRLGPTINHTPTRNYTNFLDGFGRVSKWEINGLENRVNYQSNIIRSLQFNASDNGQDMVRHVTQQKTQPEMGMGSFAIKDMDNTDVALFTLGGDKSTFVTVTDFAQANVIDMRTLRTLGSFEYDDSDNGDLLKGAVFSGSHNGEWVDPEGEVHIVNWVGKKSMNNFEIFVYTMSPSDHKRRVVGSVSLSWQPYSIHAIAVTGDYAVIILGHVSMSFMETGMSMCLSCNVDDKLQEKPVLVYVFKLAGDDVGPTKMPIWSLEIPKEQAFFVFHYINAQLNTRETDDHEVLTIDMCVYEDMDGVLGDHVLGDLQNVLTPSVRDSMRYNCDAIKRLKIDVTAGSIDELVELPAVDAKGFKYHMELVSTNPSYWGKNACYGYGFTMHVGGSPHYADMGIGKVNFCAAEGSESTIDVFHRSNTYVGEPLFVPAPGALDEDEGSLLVVSMDGETGNTNLLVLNAKTMDVVATVKAAFPTMFEFHGLFIPS
eukprot:GSChrysophyteH1.ASY1.ANO1.3221.1 assembled CDS